jgi:hypothetical protein
LSQRAESRSPTGASPGSRPEDDRSALRALALIRIAVGVLLILRTTPLLAPLHLHFLRGVAPLLGWPDRGFHAPVPGLGLPVAVIAGLCLVRTAAAVALVVGVGSRVAGVAAGVTGYLVLAQDEIGFVQTLHLLYGSALLVGLTDAGAVLALVPDQPRAPRSSLWLLRLWVASVYLWAGLAKLHADWLDGRALGFFLESGALGGPLAGALLSTPWRHALVARAVAVGELALGPALAHPRTRRFALPAAFAFHFGIELMARPDLLGWIMMSLLVAFVPLQGEQTARAAGHTTSA